MTNLEIIRELYECFRVRDLDRLREIMHPQIRWNQMDHFPAGGKRIGPDEIFEHVFAPFRTDWTGFRSRVDEFIDGNDRVVAVGVYEGTFNATGKTVHAPFTHVYEIKNGQVTRFDQYTDTHAMHLARTLD